MRVGIAATVRRTIPEMATATARHLMIAAAALLLFATHAHAQVCQDPDAEQGSDANPTPSATPGGAAGTDQYFLNCDMEYKNTELMCDTFKVRGSCPAEPMEMKTTPKRSLIKDFSPFLYAYARDPDDRSRPYSGAYYRGTPGDASQTFGLVCPPGRRCPASCTAQLKFRSEARSPEEEAKMVRLQLDNCANQYIVNSARFPLQKENTYLLSGEDPANGAARIGKETSCQPLKTVLDTKNEYFPTVYLRAAWIKLMQDPAYRLNPKAPNEPHLPDGVTIENPIPPPSPFEDVRLSQIGAVKYEEINDPTHPFSPRWDYEFNERDHYSPMTASYSGDPANSVFCAGDKKDQILKVDILSFREANLKFDDKITKRIDFNKNCKANSGPQKNPCCVPSGFGGLTCKLLPCAQCYGMTPEKPVCSTDYTNLPDRRKLKIPYLPVHPALRVVGAIQSLSQLSLTNLNSITGGVLNVAQASGLISSQLGILNMLPGNLPFADALPLLTGQANLMQALPNLAPQLLSTALGGQANLLGMLPGNLSLNQVTGLLSGQGNILGALTSATGLPIGSAMSVLQSPQNLLNMLPTNSVLGDARQLLNQQVGMVNNLVDRGMSVANAGTNLINQARALENVNPNVLLSDAANAGAGAILDYRGLGLPGNMSVGQARNLIGSTANSLVNFNPNGSLSQYSNLLNGQVGQLLGLPQNLPVQQVASMIGSAQGVLQGLGNGNLQSALSGQALNSVTGVINGQLGQLTGLPINITSSQLGSIIGGQSGILSALGGSLNPNQIAGMLTSQIGQLGQLGQMAGAAQGLASALTTGNISGLLNSQLGALSGLPGLSSLSSVAGILDTNILGGIPGLPGVPGLPSPSPSNTLPTLAVVAMIPAIGPSPRTAKCNPNEFAGANSTPMAQLCTALRAPFTPMNKLKMRYHNPDEEENIVLKEGVPEGYTFKEYFKDTDPQKPAHMPYPRLWDTGRSIQRTASDQQDPKDDSGQWTAIVGVGHEATPGDAEPPEGDTREEKAKAQRMKDQRCMYGGWGGNVSMGGASIQLPDPIASWTELKLYQTRTLRDLGLSCLARYEKSYKLGSGEEKALLGFGADPTQGVITETDSTGKNTFTSVAKWLKDNPDRSQPMPGMSQLRQESFPLAWRGYLSAKDDDQKFPNFPAGTATMETGLDKAQPGDIIVMENGASGENAAGKRGLPRLALVTREMTKGSWIKVMEADNGKWPDVCGTTDGWGELKTRYLYKGSVPKEAQNEYRRIGSTDDCADPHLTQCVAKNWDTLKLYRPRANIREGNDGSELKDPPPAPPNPGGTTNTPPPASGGTP